MGHERGPPGTCLIECVSTCCPWRGGQESVDHTDEISSGPSRCHNEPSFLVLLHMKGWNSHQRWDDILSPTSSIFFEFNKGQMQKILRLGCWLPGTTMATWGTIFLTFPLHAFLWGIVALKSSDEVRIHGKFIIYTSVCTPINST